MKGSQSRTDSSRKEQSPTILQGIQYSIDFVTAILLLTGKIFVTGLFVVPEGFLLSSSGPLLGGIGMKGRSDQAEFVLDIIDIIAALLLIIGAIRVTGPYVSSGSLFIVFSGPIFGFTSIPGAVSPLNSTTSATECKKLRSFVKSTMLQRLKDR